MSTARPLLQGLLEPILCQDCQAAWQIPLPEHAITIHDLQVGSSAYALLDVCLGNQIVCGSPVYKSFCVEAFYLLVAALCGVIIMEGLLLCGGFAVRL